MLEARSARLEELDKAGIRASKFSSSKGGVGGSGGLGVGASTLLQDIATNKGNLLR